MKTGGAYFISSCTMSLLLITNVQGYCNRHLVPEPKSTYIIMIGTTVLPKGPVQISMCGSSSIFCRVTTEQTML